MTFTSVATSGYARDQQVIPSNLGELEIGLLDRSSHNNAPLFLKPYCILGT